MIDGVNLRFFCVAYLSESDGECSEHHVITAEVTEPCFSSLLVEGQAQVQYERHTMRESGCSQVCLTLDLDEWPDVDSLDVVQ